MTIYEIVRQALLSLALCWNITLVPGYNIGFLGLIYTGIVISGCLFVLKKLVR